MVGIIIIVFSDRWYVYASLQSPQWWNKKARVKRRGRQLQLTCIEWSNLRKLLLVEKVESNVKAKYISVFTWIIHNQKTADQKCFGLSFGERLWFSN